MQLLMGSLVSSSLSAVANLGVADHLSHTPTSVDTLASATGAQADALYRVLRMLASLGVFRQEGRAFALAPAGEFLRQDHPQSLRAMVMMFGDPWRQPAFPRMTDVIRTGINGIRLAHGKDAFDLFAGLPAEAERFHNAMTSFSSSLVPAVLAAYDFSGIQRLADSGGGHGSVLGRILRHYPHMQGVLFDLPEVVAGAPASGNLAGCDGRVSIQSGSFFDTAPAGCDAFIFKHILHDWDDERCVRILQLTRAQLPAHGRVLLIEMVVEDSPAPLPAKFLDIEMLLVTPGGRERSAPEFAALFAQAGLRLSRVVPTPSPVCVVEATVA